MNLSEHLVRIIRALQAVGHDQKIHAARVKWKGLGLSHDASGPTANETFFWQHNACVGLEGDAVGTQQVHMRKTDLKRMIAKDIRNHGIELLLLPGLDVSAGIRLEPAGKLYNTG